MSNCGENIKYDDDSNLIFGLSVSSLVTQILYDKSGPVYWYVVLQRRVCHSVCSVECPSVVSCLSRIQDPSTFHIHIDIHYLREPQTEPRGCFRFQRCL